MPQPTATKANIAPSVSTHSCLCDNQKTTDVQLRYLVNANDADIAVRSSDNTIFRLHRRHIEVQAGAFNPAHLQQIPEQVHVSNVLFQFIYPKNQNCGSNCDCGGKYRVFSAMHVSQMRRYDLTSSYTWCRAFLQKHTL